MRRVRLRAAARADINAIMENIGRDSLRSAHRLFRAVEKLAMRLTDFPELGAVYENDDVEFADLRVFSVPKFWNYLVFYRVHDDEIEVVRVIHGASDIPAILEG
jgi:toxin ParE1/3/4